MINFVVVDLIRTTCRTRIAEARPKSIDDIRTRAGSHSWA